MTNNLEEKDELHIQNQYISDVSNLPKFSEGINNLSVFHLNIRSISKNYNELQIVLQQANVVLDIISLTET